MLAGAFEDMRRTAARAGITPEEVKAEDDRDLLVLHPWRGIHVPKPGAVLSLLGGERKAMRSGALPAAFGGRPPSGPLTPMVLPTPPETLAPPEREGYNPPANA